MRRGSIRIQYNSPVVLSFSLACLLVLWLHHLTNGRSTAAWFSVYRSGWSDLGTYPRFVLHVLGHSSYAHLLSNLMMILVVGPPLEEKYGSRPLFWSIFLTALVSGMVHWLFFPGTALMGASGIVFMMIAMSSLSGMRDGCIPLTLILVLVLYIGGEVVRGVTLSDNVSQLTHIIGGVCGAFLGLSMRR